MHRPNRTLTAMTVALGLLAGCDGESSHSGHDHGPAPKQTTTGVAPADHGHDHGDHSHAEVRSLGSVRIGSYEVEALQEGKVEPGKEATFELRLKNASAEPDAIRVWIGIESGRGSAKGKAHKHGEKIEVHCDVPNPIPAESRFWIELETAGEKLKGAVDYKAD